MDCVWDIIVIGAGVVGSATAYQAAKAGCRTLLLEQFSLPHTRGSSHGESRIIRKAYNQLYYAEMMREAYSNWATLEQEAGSQLYTKTGVLSVDEKDSQELKNLQKALTNVNGEYQRLSSEKLASLYPMFSFPSNYIGIFDCEGGILASDRALEAFKNEFLKLGGTVHDSETVIQIIPGDIVKVITHKNAYQGRSVILTAGSWTNKICKNLHLNLPLKVKRIGVYYWREKEEKGDYSVHQHCPALSWFPYNNSSDGIYAIPSREVQSPVKVCIHDGPESDPDVSDLSSSENNVYLNKIKRFIRRHLPGLNDQPSITESCTYTITPDEDFILDNHPEWNNIVIGAGFSGHGFKMAPVLGKLLCELATNRRPSFDLTPFRISRFASSKL